MKITNNITPYYTAHNKPENKTGFSNINNSAGVRHYDNIKYSQIPFRAIYNVKTGINIDSEKSKLLKQITELLNLESQKLDFGELFVNTFRQTVSYIRNLEARKLKILEELESLSQSKSLNPQQKVNRANELKKEYKAIKNSKIKTHTAQKANKADVGIDFQLLNKFKSAISEDNFDLRKVFNDYYKGLNNIKSLEELSEKYPNIKIPPRPEEVIATKIENTLTRDFYEDLDQLMDTKDKDAIANFLERKIKSITNEMAKQNNVNPHALFLRVGLNTGKKILARYEKLSLKDGFSAIPEQRKIKLPQLTNNDLYLLAVRYDDFVLDVLRKQYLDLQKVSNIVYSDGNVTIPLSSIKEADYKFEKIPEKIKKLFTISDNLKAAQRDYDKFNTEQLKKRLAFFANNELGNNEELLEHIISFDSCNFAPGDVKSLIKFMRELDAVQDGQKSLEEGLKTIKTQELRPKETERLNELEHQKMAEKIKLEQQKAFELTALKNKFDDAINMLYQNNMNSIASTCSKYRPLSLDKTTADDAEYIISTITNSISDNGKISNKNKLESNIMRWDTYNYYKNSETTNEIFRKATALASNKNGNVDVDKAGQYILNAEIVKNYPSSKDMVRNPEILSKIMDKAATEDLAIKYLCKYDNYIDLSPADKTKISNFIDMFDVKDQIDKLILKDIIENDYVKCDTTVHTYLNSKSSETVDATIASSAKEQIIEKYKFPTCLEFLKGFEDALSSTAGNRGTSGLKKTGQNNRALEHKMEVKLIGHDDRLFSSKNNYYFDIFSNTGLH